MNKMEIEAKRMNYGRMQSETLGKRNERGWKDKHDDGIRRQSFQREVEMKERQTLQNQPILQDQTDGSNGIQRHNSWADEAEEEIRRQEEIEGNSEMAEWGRKDREQWTGERRIPSNWADELSGDVREAGDKLGRAKPKEKEIGAAENNKEKGGNNSRMMDDERMERGGTNSRKVDDKRMEKGEINSRKMDNERMERGGINYRNMDNERKHKCIKEEEMKIRHWFGDSDSSENDTSDDNENWTTVERERRSKEKKKRQINRKKERMEEVATKAKIMAGIGPISDEDIEKQRKITKNYERAKVWAIKEHLDKNV